MERTPRERRCSVWDLFIASYLFLPLFVDISSTYPCHIIYHLNDLRSPKVMCHIISIMLAKMRRLLRELPFLVSIYYFLGFLSFAFAGVSQRRVTRLHTYHHPPDLPS